MMLNISISPFCYYISKKGISQTLLIPVSGKIPLNIAARRVCFPKGEGDQGGSKRCGDKFSSGLHVS